jgi:hypothetical protein
MHRGRSFRLRRALKRHDYSGRAVAGGFSTFKLDASKGYFTSVVLTRIHNVSPTRPVFAQG